MEGCERIRVRIEEAFIRHDLSLLGPVRDHLTGCPGCQGHYHRLFEAEASLGQGQAEPERLLSLPEQELLRRMVLPEEGKRFGWPRWPRLLPALSAAAVACALVMAMLLLPRRPQREDALTPRGTGFPASSAGTPVGLRVLCLTSREGKTEVHSLGAQSRAHCGRSDTLGFAYRNDSAQPWYLQIVARAADGSARRVFPEDRAAGQPLAPARDDTPLEASLSLTELGPGPVTLVAVFSGAPQDPGALVDAVGRGRDPGGAGGTGQRHVIRLAVEVGP